MSPQHIILYAEDDPDDVYIVNQAFEHHKHLQVVHAPNGREALNILKQLWTNNSLPCLIILDINMPVVDGKEALKHIKTSDEFNQIPVVLFSTSSSHSDNDFAQKWGAELITKPLDYKDLEGLASEFVKRCNLQVTDRN